MAKLWVRFAALLCWLLVAGLMPATAAVPRATLAQRCERIDQIEQRTQRKVATAERRIEALRDRIEQEPTHAPEYRQRIREQRRHIRRLKGRFRELERRCDRLNGATTQHPRIYLPGERARLVRLLTSEAPGATRFKSFTDANLDRSFGELWDSDVRMWSFALLANLTGERRYCRKAVDGIEWFVADEEARIAAYDPDDRTTLPRVAHDSYLDIGPLVGDVMLVFDWCHDSITASQRDRWLHYADRAVWNVWHPEDAVWGNREAAWSGWSIDNPSNNYYYSFLRATMLLGLGAEGELASAGKWRRFFRTTKIEQQLAPTFAAELVGGGSREGTGYGTAMMRLWELYDIWEASTGEDIASLTGHARASLVQLLHYIVPTKDHVSLNGDHSRDSTGALFDYHRHYGQALAHLLADDGPADRELAGRARRLFDTSSVPEMQNGFMLVYDFLYDISDVPNQPVSELNTAYYAAGVGQLFARSSWDRNATWLNLTAGPYTESHAHRDQGSFLLYKLSWMAVDPNYFSHSGIRQEEELHNLVRLVDAEGNTITQREGTVSTVEALHQGEGWLHVAVDTTAAYGDQAGPGAPVGRVQRELVFIEPEVIVVFDRVTTTAAVQQRWQLNTPTMPVIAGAAATIASGPTELHLARVIPATATTTVFDWSTDDDMSGGYRLDTARAGGSNTFLHVLSFDDAVTSTVRSDASGRQGVTLTLTDGRTVTLRFSPTAVDTTLRIEGGPSPAAMTLGPSVDSLPELSD